MSRGTCSVFAEGTSTALEIYTRCQWVTDAGGQSKCRAERSQALEQARRPQESMFVPECNEDGTFAQVCSTFIFTFIREAGWAHPSAVASAGPVSHSDRLLLVRHQRRQTSERLLRAQQDSGVFRYCGNKQHPLGTLRREAIERHGGLSSQSRRWSAGLSTAQTVWGEPSDHFTASLHIKFNDFS